MSVKSVKKIFFNSYGVTLLEIIFVTAILGILAELVAHNFIANTPKYRLNGAARRVAMSLMEARNRSLQQSVNTEVEFLDQGKSYSIWYDFDYDNWLFAIIWAESKSFHNRLISVFFGCVHFATRMPGAESA